MGAVGGTGSKIKGVARSEIFTSTGVAAIVGGCGVVIVGARCMSEQTWANSRAIRN